MGHRIELEEVDIAIGSICGIDRVCTFFDEAKNKMVSFMWAELIKQNLLRN